MMEYGALRHIAYKYGECGRGEGGKESRELWDRIISIYIFVHTIILYSVF